MKIAAALDRAIAAALDAEGAPGAPAIVRQAQRPEFGHYQANGVMGAAKKLGCNPRELAEKIVARLDLPMAEKIEVAGPGFLNIHLSAEYLSGSINAIAEDARLGIPLQESRNVVVDYSSPNLAKEMHIGHLRSTTIGDALVRTLEFMGHNVIRQNHVGDWGAQFGSLLAYLDTLSHEELKTELSDLEAFYREASKMFRSDEAFANRAREFVVRLQSGDETCMRLWKQFIGESISHGQQVYDKLDITLTPENIAAESGYNDTLGDVVDELTDMGLITNSDGALCVFLDEFKGKDGTPLPAIVRKSDGGYGYMATDLAAIRHRTRELSADVSLYVVGSPQSLHFQQLFAVARAAGFLEDQDFRHLAFGSILNKEGKMFKTRDGADVKLIDVVDEAMERAFEVVSQKNAALDEETRRNVARVVGAGAMKYAELSKNRTTDYVFDFDTMLAFDGNTAPYLQYAYTRIRSVFRRADIEPDALEATIDLQEPAETNLALKLLQFEEAIDLMLDDYQPNVLCTYLFELAGMFSTFYENCPILKAEPEVRDSRLALADITARTLKQGLAMLGIFTVEQM